MKLSILTSFSWLLIFFSCKKTPIPETKGPDCSDKPIMYIDSELQNFKFKMGSYWIFIDPVYPIVDTMRLASVSFDGLATIEYCPNNYYEKYKFSIYSSYFTNSNTHTFTISDTRVLLSELNADINGIFTTKSSKIDSIYIYDRYYKSVGTYRIHNNKYYINADYGFLKLEVLDNSGNVISQKLLKDKFIVR